MEALYKGHAGNSHCVHCKDVVQIVLHQNIWGFKTYFVEWIFVLCLLLKDPLSEVTVYMHMRDYN